MGEEMRQRCIPVIAREPLDWSKVIPPVLRITRPQLMLLASWLAVSAALAAVGVVIWFQPNALLAGAFWAAAAVVAVGVVALAVWYRSRRGDSRPH